MAADESKVKDNRLYDVLGVAPTATTHEISVAYRRKREQVRVRERRRPHPARHLPTAAANLALWDSHPFISSGRDAVMLMTSASPVRR